MHSSNDAQTTATSDIMDYDDNLILPENGVYTTEIYPEAYLPSSASSSEFSSADSSPQLTGVVVDSMILDHKDLHMLALPPPPPRIIRKPSKTIINRRNSVLLDVIEEEEPSAVNEEKVTAGALVNGQPSSTIAAAAAAVSASSSSSQVHCQRVE